MNVKQAVADRFTQVARNYASSPVHRGGPELEAMLAAAALAGRERVLDLGCGPGHTALAFAGRGARVVAVDLAEAMLEEGRRLASERGLDVRFEQADVEALPLEDAAYDIATSRFSAHHYPRPELALREAARVLRPGGCLLLADSVAPEAAAEDTFLNAIEVLRDPTHVRDHSPSQWLAMLRGAGLAAEQLGSWWLELDFESWITRNGASPRTARAIREVFRAAPSDVRAPFGLASGDEPRFRIPVALFRGGGPG